MAIHPWLNTAVSAARKAGDVIMRAYARLDELEVTDKGRQDLVTQVDTLAEEVIIDTLRSKYPDHGFLAEESGEKTGSDATWIIDPIDGTLNFVHGYPVFGVSIACRVEDTLEHAVIYHPFTQALYTASRGAGAFLDQHRVRVSERSTLEGALIGCGCSARVRHSPATMESFLDLQRALWRSGSVFRWPGASVAKGAYVAAGYLDGYFDMGVKPWDIAAAVLLVKEAGGFVSDFSGGDGYFDSGFILAGNPKIHPQLVEIFTGFDDIIESAA